MSSKASSALKTKRRARLRTAQNETSLEGARQALLRAAKKLFARQGLSGTSIRDIAREANINSSLISYYFDGKEGLYRECLREIGEARLTFAQQILQPPENQEAFKLRLKLFAESLMAVFLEDRDAGLIIIREYDRVHSPAEKVFKDTFLRIFDLIKVFFTDAQKAGLIDASRDPFILASLFFGALSGEMRLDHLKEKTYGRTLKDPDEKRRMLDHLADLFSK